MNGRACTLLSFQFPPPRGGELVPSMMNGSTAHFNSRPREGANVFSLLQLPNTLISIPAPARGRTPPETPAVQTGWDFNSRPREGANRLRDA